MRYFMYVVFVVALLSAYVGSPDPGIGPAAAKYLPELVSALLMVYVVATGAQQQFRYVNVKYWLIFGALALTIMCGPLVNHEAVGPIINGMRYYVRAIPLFFVPAVFNFSDHDIKGFLKALLVLSLIQVPLAIYQRYSYAAHGWHTGDGTFGTLMNSGILSLFLISVLCVLSALMLRGRISKLWFGLCFLLLVIPMSINETKVTVFLLPLGLLATFLVAAPAGRRSVVTLQALGLLIVAGTVFVPLYDYLNKDVPGQFSIVDFFSNSKEVDKYMNRKAGVGTGEEAGRMVALVAPFNELSHDPIAFVFGLGLGNASKSSLGPQFSGKYMALYWNFMQQMSVTAFLFELGMMGTGLVLLLHWMVLRDALVVSRQDGGLVGVIALGYVGAWITISIGLFYSTIHASEAVAYNFWFFAGLFAARRQRLALNRKAATVKSSALGALPAL